MHRLTITLLSVLLLGCARTPEAAFAKYLREGKEFAAKRDYSRAVLQFKNASKIMPKDAEPYYQLGLMAVSTDQMAAAAEYLKQAIALNPQHVDAVIALADLFTRAAQPSGVEEGKRLAQRALAMAPGNLRAQNLIALADMRNGGAKTAAVQLEKKLLQFPQDTETSINLARARLMLNDRRGAEELLRNSATASPGDARALFALADFYNILSDSLKSVEWYERGLRADPNNGPALAALGRLQTKNSRHQEADATFARLSKNPDRRFRYVYAMRLQASGRKDAAVAEFTRIAQENPEDREAQTRLIAAYLDSGRTAEAENLLDKILAADSKNVDALSQRARVQLLRGKVEAAEKDIQIVQQYRPESSETHFLLAQVQRFRQNEQLQLSELSEALRLDPHYSPARLDLSRSLLRSDPQRALTLLDSAPEDQRQNLDFQIQRIWPLIELRRLEEARAAIDALLDAGIGEVQFQDAVLRMLRKDFSAALGSAQKALTANPGDVRVLELILRCALAENRQAQGIEIIRRHASQNPKLAGVQMFLGRIEFQAGNAREARAAFNTAKAAAPDSLEPDWSLIDLDIAERRFEDARRRITPLLQGSSEAIATARLARLEQSTGNYNAATQHYRRVLQIRPSDAGSLNNLAYILTEFLGDPNEALRYAKTAKELTPKDPAVDDTIGWTYYRLGRYDDAVRHLEMAVKGTPSARHHAHLAMAYARIGDRIRAKQTLRAALKLDPDLPEGPVAQKIVEGNAPGVQSR